MLLNFLELLHGQQHAGQEAVIEVPLGDLQVVEGAFYFAAVPANALRQHHGAPVGGFRSVFIGFFAYFL